MLKITWFIAAMNINLMMAGKLDNIFIEWRKCSPKDFAANLLLTSICSSISLKEVRINTTPNSAKRKVKAFKPTNI